MRTFTILLTCVCTVVMFGCSDSGSGITSPDTYTPPVITFYEQPEYPRLAFAAALEGEVTICVTITASAEVQNPEVVRSSGVQSLDESALFSASRCIWQPATRFGRPIKAAAEYIVPFRLER